MSGVKELAATLFFSGDVLRDGLLQSLIGGWDCGRRCRNSVLCPDFCGIVCADCDPGGHRLYGQVAFIMDPHLAQFHFGQSTLPLILGGVIVGAVRWGAGKPGDEG